MIFSGFISRSATRYHAIVYDLKIVRSYVSLSSCGAQLLLSVPDLLLGPEGVGNVLLLLQLSGGVHGEPGGVQGPGVTVRASLARTFITPGQHPALTISSEGAKGTDPLPGWPHQAAVDVEALSVNVPM